MDDSNFTEVSHCPSCNNKSFYLKNWKQYTTLDQIAKIEVNAACDCGFKASYNTCVDLFKWPVESVSKDTVEDIVNYIEVTASCLLHEGKYKAAIRTQRLAKEIEALWAEP